MAISLRAAGTPTAATVNVGSVAPAVPAGATTGDLSVLTVWMKPYNTTITTPTGWTKIGEHTNGTTAGGTDTGSMKVAVFVQESAAVGAIPALSMTNANSVGAVINTYAKGATEYWDYTAFTQGFDAVNDANYSATGGAGINVAAGDWVVASTAVCGDIGTVSAQAIAGMSGATLGTIANRTNSATTTGNDSRGLVSDIPVSSGSSTAAPTFTYTNASATSGTTIWLRLRVGALTSVSKSLSTTWNVLKQVPKTLSTTWNALQSVGHPGPASNTTDYLWIPLGGDARFRVPYSGTADWEIKGEFYTTCDSGYAPYLPNGCRLINSSYYTSSGDPNTVYTGAGATNAGAYGSNGNALSVTKGAWTSVPWAGVGLGGGNVAYIDFSIPSTLAFANGTLLVRNLSFWIGGVKQMDIDLRTHPSLSLIGGAQVYPKSLSTLWNVLVEAATTPVSKSLSTLWNVNAQVSKALSTTWNVQSIISKALSTTWNVRTSVSNALSTTWNVRSAISKALSTTWNVNSIVSKSLATSWNVLASITQTLSTLWNVLSDGGITQVAKSLSTLWNVQAQVSKPLSTSWNVRSYVTATKSTLWNVLTSTTKTLSTTWNVRSIVTKPLSTSWNVLGSISKSLSTTWNVRAQVSKALSTSWNVTGRVTQALSTSWNVWTSVSPKTLSTTWNVLSQVSPKTLGTTWHVRAYTSKSLSTTWNVRAYTGNTLSTSWNVLKLITATKSTLWNVNSSVVISISTSWNVKAPIQWYLWNGSTLIPLELLGVWNGSSLDQLVAPWTGEIKEYTT